jgi:protein-S-isoprenylcysteine O-methyltransferase Ste14
MNIKVGQNEKRSRYQPSSFMKSIILTSFAVGAVVLAPPSCTAFAPTARVHEYVVKPKLSSIMYAQEGSNGDGIGKILESFPSTDVVRENIMDGKFGERGEQYVIAQFSLFLFIAIGNIPFIGDTITAFLAPLLILSGLLAVYKSAADLKDNLSPWPVPTDTESGRGSLVNTGIYAFVRHPMYTGVLLGMAGLSIITDSVARMILTCALYYVLDIKSDYEEEKLGEVYGDEYEKYKHDVQDKFFPAGLRSLWSE